ncbi:DEHA2D11154p [Debaryomyces hansenii CBS767]|uniref:DEHA2D11154p n=1 Tax=Debaryomyces hansenii (strain ATCC 36239 / CBS 767 / BCRC 21394 / JCM 1990 / NBRC 0083 / IGC 2968) TaxID=284592 RepID=Q6BS70_DEBHA|nr:DEHA2D11154p [Debaryomyces hansenii CBS767]CAG87111.2 DEHA2D11154p [Debaryomyces hansenii CBS767]|eukprot:XP_458950.2 DEHA2D11154p [Debaryomyces hansenii CBS767]
MNTINKQFLSKESLFLKFPNVPLDECNIEDLLVGIKSKQPYNELIDLTYYLLKNNSLSLSELLKIWEIRLILHLFNNQLTFSKKEAINLNNALYLNENNDIAPPQGQQVQNPNSNNDSRASSMNSGIGNTPSPSPGLQPIYPLPKNNNGLIGHSLLIMILRLRSIPNLSLVNELYKLCYQLRLRSSGAEEEKVGLQLKLINLSYDIIVILSITKNYHTLLNYLESIRYELVLQKKQNQLSDMYRQYLSNVTLLWVIILIMVYVRNGTKKDRLTDIITKHYQDTFENDVNELSMNSLSYVLSHISPLPSSEEMATVPPGALTISHLVQLILSGDISGRIICSTIGLWDISNVHGYSLTKDDEFKLNHQPSDASDNLSSCYNELTSDWGRFIYKVYGLE